MPMSRVISTKLAFVGFRTHVESNAALSCHHIPGRYKVHTLYMKLYSPIRAGVQYGDTKHMQYNMDRAKNCAQIRQSVYLELKLYIKLPAIKAGDDTRPYEHPDSSTFSRLQFAADPNILITRIARPLQCAHHITWTTKSIRDSFLLSAYIATDLAIDHSKRKSYVVNFPRLSTGMMTDRLPPRRTASQLRNVFFGNFFLKSDNATVLNVEFLRLRNLF